MSGLLEAALALHYFSHVDSRLESTRLFWRKKLGATDAQAADPRPWADVLKDNRSRGTD